MNNIKQNILNEMKVKPVIDAKKEINERVKFIKDYLISSGLNTLILGISGGQDSTLVGKLAQLAVNDLNRKYNTVNYKFIAVRLPYGSQLDEDDCQKSLQFIEPSKVIYLNIKNSVDNIVRSLENGGEIISDFVKGNIKARVRMTEQYAIAGIYNGIVLGTDHSAESVTGFYTKFGDGAADIMPIFGLNKRQGKKLLKELNCPEHLYLKVPTADLEDNKPQFPDEVSLGVSYDEIDDFLEGKNIDLEKEKTIIGHFLKTRHKRSLPKNIYN